MYIVHVAKPSVVFVLGQVSDLPIDDRAQHGRGRTRHCDQSVVAVLEVDQRRETRVRIKEEGKFVEGASVETPDEAEDQDDTSFQGKNTLMSTIRIPDGVYYLQEMLYSSKRLRAVGPGDESGYSPVDRAWHEKWLPVIVPQHIDTLRENETVIK
jgi:hypothetical protein